MRLQTNRSGMLLPEFFLCRSRGSYRELEMWQAGSTADPIKTTDAKARCRRLARTSGRCWSTSQDSVAQGAKVRVLLPQLVTPFQIFLGDDVGLQQTVPLEIGERLEEYP